MEAVQLDRRNSSHTASATAHPVDTAQLVRQAIILQAYIGTRGAVEYMKAHQIHGAVINRVLSGGAMRHQDQISRDKPVAWE